MKTLRLLAIGATLLASACSSVQDLAKCSGPLIPMNTTRWQPTPAQMAQMERLAGEVCL